VSYALAGLILVEYGLILPPLLNSIALPFWLKASIVFALVGPLSICLGTFVPSAFDHLKLTSSRFVPWAWAFNAIFSFLAPVVSIAFAIAWGGNALLLAAIPFYLAVGLVWPASRTRSEMPGEAC